MKTQKNGISAVLPPNLNPLVNPADLDVHPLVDAVRRMDGDCLRIHVLEVSPTAEDRAYRHHEESNHAQQDDFRGLSQLTHSEAPLLRLSRLASEMYPSLTFCRPRNPQRAPLLRSGSLPPSTRYGVCCSK
jgi:hypothetical protein